ncbi:MAG: carboxymuconolactone decarboxylase family protein [Ferrovibrio sp.]|uniref:carboxymuconolactone decarboxylase family protein n=1 Tax=Ferrovibrio sp. TaxID=1917215 RepID=UPI0026105F4B|nr:carboxymuconolactone decarboxylase family protein [Ferrovibrio sp.]MCW0236360.1 carboxymuconolactone decarboxylase family protein [Ferrovibrio sp.]
MPRLAPLAKPYPPEAAAELAQMPADLGLFRTVAHNPRVLSRWRGGGLLDKGSITLRQRELLILRTTARLKAEYEWGVHVGFFGAKAKFSEREIRATVHGAATDWKVEEAVLVEIADALIDSGTVDDVLWHRAAGYYKADQLIEIIALVGFYHLVSFTVNATGVALEPGAPRFPTA